MKLKAEDLEKQIKKAASKIFIGKKYFHYKNPTQTYTVLDLGIQEATNKICVIYKADYVEDITFVRDLDIWLSKPIINGKKVERFTLVK